MDIFVSGMLAECSGSHEDVQAVSIVTQLSKETPHFFFKQKWNKHWSWLRPSSSPKHDLAVTFTDHSAMKSELTHANNSQKQPTPTEMPENTLQDDL